MNTAGNFQGRRTRQVLHILLISEAKRKMAIPFPPPTNSNIVTYLCCAMVCLTHFKELRGKRQGGRYLKASLS